MPTRQAPITTAQMLTLPRKLFSVDEANRALPYVSRIVADVTEVYNRIVHLRRGLEDTPAGDEAYELERQYEQAMDRLGELVDELHQVGVELKDFEKGLVDFPAIHHGRDILLCWHAGENAVTHWHEADMGFTDRQPVDALLD